MDRRIGIGILALFLLTACRHEKPRTVIPPRMECSVKTTPVKSQGRSNLCWIYAMLATIESEHLMKGDSVNLSPMFVARQYLLEQSRQAYKPYKPHEESPRISTRGMASMTLCLLQQYGLTHWDAYHPEVNFNVLTRKLEKAVEANRGRDATRLLKSIDDILDADMRPMPRYVFLLGAEYTAQEFARSVCAPDEYVALTSYSHHPYGEEFALEVPDNHERSLFLNLQPDTLMAHIDQALRNGHPVCWEGDTSEPGFNWPQGIARLGKTTERSVLTGAQLATVRQETFENGKTTDDHCMELVGIARTPKGKKFYLAKNSWGTGNAYHGYIYLSENYVRLKTLAVWMSQEAFLLR